MAIPRLQQQGRWHRPLICVTCFLCASAWHGEIFPQLRASTLCFSGQFRAKRDPFVHRAALVPEAVACTPRKGEQMTLASGNIQTKDLTDLKDLTKEIIAKSQYTAKLPPTFLNAVKAVHKSSSELLAETVIEFPEFMTTMTYCESDLVTMLAMLDSSKEPSKRNRMLKRRMERLADRFEKALSSLQRLSSGAKEMRTGTGSLLNELFSWEERDGRLVSHELEGSGIEHWSGREKSKVLQNYLTEWEDALRGQVDLRDSAVTAIRSMNKKTLDCQGAADDEDDDFIREELGEVLQQLRELVPASLVPASKHQPVLLHA